MKRALGDKPMRLGLGLLVATLGGMLAKAVGLPLPWVLGAMICIAALALTSGTEQRQPPSWRRIAQIVIGLALGLFFTPTVLNQTMALAPWIVLGALSALGLSFLAAPVFQRLANTDGATAIYSVALGASAEMVLQAQRAGADGASVASAHATRIIVVTSAASLLASMLGQSLSASTPNTSVIPALQLTLLFSLAGVAAWTLHKFRLPNPWLLGPLVIGGLFAGTLGTGRLPESLIIVAQILIGWALGQNITRAFFVRAPRLLFSAVMVTLGILSVCLMLAAVISNGASLPLMTSFIALVPGGIAEMGVIAKAFGLGAPIVTAFHVTRIIATIFMTQSLSRWMLSSGWVRH